MGFVNRPMLCNFIQTHIENSIYDLNVEIEWE